jgi:hypothetical protein
VYIGDLTEVKFAGKNSGSCYFLSGVYQNGIYLEGKTPENNGPNNA